MKYFLFLIGAIGLATSFPMHRSFAKEITLSSVEKKIRTDITLGSERGETGPGKN